MSFCVHCGQPTHPENGGNSAKQLEQQPDAQFCRECGAPAGIPITWFPPDAQFCRECGAPASIPIRWFLPAEPEYMGFWIRAAAVLIDMVVIGAIWELIEIFYGPLSTKLTIILLSCIMYPLYYVAPTGLRGQTLGKMALGIMVVNERGEPPGILRAAFREIFGKFVSYIVLYRGYFSIIWDEEKQGWHDHIASTYVISAPGRRGRPASRH